MPLLVAKIDNLLCCGGAGISEDVRRWCREVPSGAGQNGDCLLAGEL
jgi:hypothetical protein